MDFQLVFRIIGFGVVLGIGSQILRQIGREDIANIASVLAVVICLVTVIWKIAEAFSKAQSIFHMF